MSDSKTRGLKKRSSDSEGKAVMVMATLHGTTIEIKMPDDHRETFELARVGTLKEFETVKTALEEKARALQLSIGNNDSLRAQVKDALAKAEESSKAYVAEKEAREDSNEERGRLHGLLESEKETSAVLNGKLNADRARLTELQAEFATTERVYRETREEVAGLATALASVRAARQAAIDANASLTSELDNLMHAKSSLEETNTALEVSQKELCECRASLGAEERAHMATGKECGKACYEREKSNATLADLKAELLKHAGCMSDVLDAMHEKLTGE